MSENVKPETDVNEYGCCAHSRVVPKKTYDSPGHVIAETWMCMDCGTEFSPASRLSALAERVERAEALLKETTVYVQSALERCGVKGCDTCDGTRDLLSRISSFLHDGTKGEGK